MRVDVFTPSWGRPEALLLCQQWFTRQDYEHKHHIVAVGPHVFRNLLECIEMSDGDAVVIMEDDDWYPFDWISTCVKHLEKHALIGQRIERLYHIPSGGYDIHTAKAASFHSIAFRAELREVLSRVCFADCWNKRGPEIEIPFQHQAGGAFLIDGWHMVSMKGMPGTKGYSKKHDASWYKKHDKDGSVLERWIGDDANYYRPWLLR